MVEMLPESTTPSKADAMASPVRLLTLEPLLALLPDGNAVSLLLNPMLPWGSGTWKKGNLTERNSKPNSGEWTPMTTRPASLYFAAHALM